MKNVGRQISGTCVDAFFLSLLLICLFASFSICLSFFLSSLFSSLSHPATVISDSLSHTVSLFFSLCSLSLSQHTLLHVSFALFITPLYSFICFLLYYIPVLSLALYSHEQWSLEIVSKFFHSCS